MFTLKAPAKINWFLKVLRKRPDCYHDILSLMQCVSLYDLLTFEETDGLEVITEAPIPLHENLAYLAMVLLRDVTNTKRGCRITLTKEIPLRAGLGGGSSNAACALQGLNKLWNINMTISELSVLAQKLGSDVPFFLTGPASLVEGRGEIISPIKVRYPAVLLLVKPPVDVSTKWAYDTFDVLEKNSRENDQELTKKDSNIKLLLQDFTEGNISKLNTLRINDLEPVVAGRYPVIREILGALVMHGASFSSMSGSGSTVFGVFRSEGEAAEVREVIAPNWCRIVTTLID